MTEADLEAKFRRNARGRWGPSRQDELLAASQDGGAAAMALVELARRDDVLAEGTPP
jgi:hypothetical protein